VKTKPCLGCVLHHLKPREEEALPYDRITRKHQNQEQKVESLIAIIRDLQFQNWGFIPN